MLKLKKLFTALVQIRYKEFGKNRAAVSCIADAPRLGGVKLGIW